MLRRTVKTLRHVALAIVYGVVGSVLLAVVLLVLHLESRPDLRVWHTAPLDAEFDVDSPVTDLDGYLALEDRLFAQLDEQVYDRIEPGDRREIDRYSRGSLSDPSRWPRNWNRTFELEVEAPRAGVLLVHGMSDSPYSMRSLALRLHDEQGFVVGLRVPGHGTAPSGLLHVTWHDMAAAVRMAMRDLASKVGDAPLVVVGYSNGAALAVEYALAALEDGDLPLPGRLVLLSPEIGITRLAALAVWQERLGHVLGLEKLAWNSILPEYDPFKYGSFALNAGKQSYLITQAIQARFDRLRDGDLLRRFPRTLAFQSVVDATIVAPALVSGLFDRLPRGGHELVLFDINRFTEVEPLLTRDPGAWLDDMLRDVDGRFTVGVVMNESEQSMSVRLRRRSAGESNIADTDLGLLWPPDTYSLSHVALPFPPDDPLYGGPDAAESPGIELGALALRGERGVLSIPASDMLRQRWNPFYDYIEERVVEAVRELTAAPDPAVYP